MATRNIGLLHVEDDVIQQRLIAHHLTMGGVPCDLACVSSEDAAIECFQQGGVDVVILDYHLTEGNGLNCLRRLRQIDRFVPIIAISGVATPEIAAKLLHAGADDYISKVELTSDRITRCVRDGLNRAETWRLRVPEPLPDSWDQARTIGWLLCSTFLARTGPELSRQLDVLEKIILQADFDGVQVDRLFQAIFKELKMSENNPNIERQLRPVLLEMRYRLSN